MLALFRVEQIQNAVVRVVGLLDRLVMLDLVFLRQINDEVVLVDFSLTEVLFLDVLVVFLGLSRFQLRELVGLDISEVIVK